MTVRALAAFLLVRHAESLGNVARKASEASGAEVISIDVRDAAVALSRLGRGQAAAFGHWLSELPASDGRLEHGARPTATPARPPNGGQTQPSFLDWAERELLPALRAPQ